MASYCARRKRWHVRLSGLDEGFTVSEKIQADMLLEQAGVSRDQQLMVLTSTGNTYVFDRIAEVLKEHHNKLHEGEKRSAHEDGSRRSSTTGWKDRRSAMSFKPRNRWLSKAYNAAVSAGSDEDGDEDESEGEAACFHASGEPEDTKTRMT